MSKVGSAHLLILRKGSMTVFGIQVSSVYVHYDMACTLPFCFVYLIFEIQGCSAYFDSTILGLAEGAQAA